MSPRYNRPLWKPVNEKQFDVRLSAFGPGTSSKSFRTKTARTLEEGPWQTRQDIQGQIEDGRQIRIIMLSSKKSTRSKKAPYLKKRCSVQISLQLLEQSRASMKECISVSELKPITVKRPYSSQKSD
jgi:hypothetical protein